MLHLVSHASGELVELLARNAVGEPGYVNTTTYVMGDQDITVNDNFRRQLFTSVIQLRN